MPAQAHVEGGVARPEAGVAASANRPLVGGVIISVDLAARKQVEGVPAVVREDRSELEARDDRALPRAIKHAGDDHFMALIERREAAVQAQIGRVLRSVVTVEIRGGDRKSTRLNSSHGYISYAVFCLKKKNNLTAPAMSKLLQPPHHALHC